MAGAVAVAGFFTLSSFDGKTLVQQKEEIAAAVTAKLETLRSEAQYEKVFSEAPYGIITFDKNKNIRRRVK